MSLQRYRLQLAARQNRGLMLYLLLAVGVHAVGLGVAHSEQWFDLKTPQNLTPIEFVSIEPSQTEPPESPKPTERRAQTNAVASRNLNSKQTAQAGQTDAQATESAAVSNSPTIPLQAQPNPVPSPAAALPQPALDQILRSEPVEPIRPSPLSRSGVPAESSLLPSPSFNPPSPTPAPPSPSPVAPPNPSLAAGLGNPLLTASASLEGQGGRLNPDRAGSGSSVDAVEDEIWGTYLSLLNQAVKRNWQRVSVAATRQTRIRFRVDRQGNLTDLRLVQPSGDTTADQAAIQAVQSAAPFSPLPQSATEETLIVNFTFTQWELAPEP